MGSSTPPRQAQSDVRIGRRRVVDNFSSSLEAGSSRRGRSCTGRVADVPGRLGEAAVDVVAGVGVASPLARRRIERCGSVPPTGTEKADAVATVAAKARAIAMLQRLFAEEMASGGQDANAAAAAALRRLNEAPQTVSQRASAA